MCITFVYRVCCSDMSIMTHQQLQIQGHSLKKPSAVLNNEGMSGLSALTAVTALTPSAPC